MSMGCRHLNNYLLFSSLSLGWVLALLNFVFAYNP